MNIAGGKGSHLRPTLVPKEQFESNWDRIFGKKETKSTEDSKQECQNCETCTNHKSVETVMHVPV